MHEIGVVGALGVQAPARLLRAQSTPDRLASVYVPARFSEPHQALLEAPYQHVPGHRFFCRD